jgi:hypothetical protein
MFKALYSITGSSCNGHGVIEFLECGKRLGKAFQNSAGGFVESTYLDSHLRSLRKAAIKRISSSVSSFTRGRITFAFPVSLIPSRISFI